MQSILILLIIWFRSVIYNFVLFSPADLPPSPFNYQWQIPLIFQSLQDENKTFEVLFTEKIMILEVPRYTLLNPRHNLYYRVNYDASMITYLTELLQMDHTRLHLLDRTGIISDQFNMLKANLTTVSTVFNLLKYAKVSIIIVKNQQFLKRI